MKVISIRNQAILQFVRKINEGGYTKDQRFFNQAANSILVKDYKHGNEKTFVILKLKIYFLLLLEELS
jgi:hypothetical protein